VSWRALLRAVTLVVLLLAVGPVRGQIPPGGIAVELNPATTAIHWTLGTTFHTVHGTFKLKSGSFRVDPATGEASGVILIDAASGESGDAARDKHMHTEVLESAKYGEITFRPSHVEGKIDLNAAGTVTVSGVLNLHGQEHPMQLVVTVERQGGGLHLVTHFKVPFVAWGMKDPSTFVLRVNKEVAVDVDVLAPLKP
jgi:polyisoprenoid-binding protein YceI